VIQVPMAHPVFLSLLTGMLISDFRPGGKRSAGEDKVNGLAIRNGA
jgi:hypothetical protein